MFRFIGFGEKAGSGADIIAKGWEENHWARPTIKDSYFPSEETELILDLLKEGGQTGGQKSGQSTTKKTTEKVLDLLKSNPYLTNREMADMLTLSEDGVFYQIKKLKAKGIIVRIGGDKGGHWEIIDK